MEALHSIANINDMWLYNYHDSSAVHLQHKLEYILDMEYSNYTYSSSNITCTAANANLFLRNIWIPIGCDEELSDSYFICEVKRGYINISERFHIKRNKNICLGDFFFANNHCWMIKASKSVIIRKYHSFMLNQWYTHVNAWALNDDTRSVIHVAEIGSGYKCLQTNMMLGQRLMEWSAVNCSLDNLQHVLSTRDVSHYNYICQSGRHLICDNGTCILNSYICDGHRDCIDGSDERDCSMVCTKTHNCFTACVQPACRCDGMYFHCRSHECIQATLMCNSRLDCADGSDEDQCSNYLSIYRAHSTPKLPISNTMVNTTKCAYGWSNCGLRSSKPCYPTKNRCIHNTNEHPYNTCSSLQHLEHCEDFKCPAMFKCHQTYCIPIYQTCDDVKDCPNGEDEDGCLRRTCYGLLRCKHSNICVHPINICDGTSQCGEHADDELHCGFSHCPSYCKCRGQLVKCSDLPKTYSISLNIKIVILENAKFYSDYALGNFIALLHVDIRYSRFVSGTISRAIFSKLIYLRTLLLLDCGIHYLASNCFIDLHMLTII